MIWHNVVVIREFFMADSTFSVLFNNFSSDYPCSLDPWLWQQQCPDKSPDAFVFANKRGVPLFEQLPQASLGTVC